MGWGVFGFNPGAGHNSVNIEDTKLSGAFIINISRINDDRGFFARSFCESEFAAAGIPERFVQCNISYNETKGALRGMHYQVPPSNEGKLVRCTHGAIFDVIVDIRPDSETYLQWISVELTAQNRTAIFAPSGFAHGFQTLVDDSEVFYQMTDFYAPDLARGFSWNDPEIGINCPLAAPIISPKDQSLSNFVE
jgi:dTDP-4-dehydrorhamnose 3,5-epimerase